MKELPDDCMMIFHGLTQYASEVFHEAQTSLHTKSFETDVAFKSLDFFMNSFNMFAKIIMSSNFFMAQSTFKILYSLMNIFRWLRRLLLYPRYLWQILIWNSCIFSWTHLKWRCNSAKDLNSLSQISQIFSFIVGFAVDFNILKTTLYSHKHRWLSMKFVFDSSPFETTFN